MKQSTFTMDTVRLALSGAIIGIAIAGLLTQFPYHDAVGGLIGGALVFVAKARHFF